MLAKSATSLWTRTVIFAIVALAVVGRLRWARKHSFVGLGGIPLVARARLPIFYLRPIEATRLLSRPWPSRVAGSALDWRGVFKGLTPPPVSRGGGILPPSSYFRGGAARG